MKRTIVFMLSILSCYVSNAMTINVKPAKNDGDLIHHSKQEYVLAKSTSVNARTYEIQLYKSKSDKGMYKLFAMTSVFMSSSNGGMKTKKMICWIPQSFKIEDIGTNDIGRLRFAYRTPSVMFRKEKWEHIGDYSEGMKINGALVGIIQMDASKPDDDGKIVKVVNCCVGAKLPKNIRELFAIAGNDKLKKILVDSRCLDPDPFSCFLEKIDE